MDLTYISNDVGRPGQSRSCNVWLYDVDLIHGTIARTVINEDMRFVLSIYQTKFQNACSHDN